jgi:hypothetical protein
MKLVRVSSSLSLSDIVNILRICGSLRHGRRSSILFGLIIRYLLSGRSRLSIMNVNIENLLGSRIHYLCLDISINYGSISLGSRPRSLIFLPL